MKIIRLAGFILAISGFCLWFGNYYISQEKVFHFYDSKLYHNLALQSWQHFAVSAGQWFDFIKQSLKNDYNANFSAPLLLPFSLFDHSRQTFILALVFFYFIPCALLLGALTRSIVQHRPRVVFYLATTIAVLTSAPWRPTLLGFPDVGGAVLLMLAVYFYIHDQRWQRWWTAPAIGLSIAAAILFRRHFAYAGLAFYAAILLEGLIYYAFALKSYLRLAFYLAIACVIQLAVMILLAPEFTLRAVISDYAALYAPYRHSVAQNLLNIRNGFGDLTLIIALSGFAIGWQRRLIERSVVVFFLLFAGLWLFIWLVIARQPTSHVLLHALLPLMIIGHTLLVYGLWQFGNRFARMLSLSVLLFIAGVFLHVFIIQDNPVNQRLAAAAPLLPTQITPSRHHAQHPQDYQTYADLAGYLRERLQGDETMYVAASSENFNGDILRSVEETFWDTGEMRKIHPTVSADVDSRDFIPLSQLINSDFVVATTPVQYHLQPEYQDVVRVVAEMFTKGSEFSKDFEQLPRVFHFDAGFEVMIYQRRQPTATEVAVRSWQHLHNTLTVDGKALLGSQLNWIALNRSRILQLSGKAQQPANISVQISAGIPSATLMYIHPLAANAVMTGQVMSTAQCSGSETVNVTLMNAAGETISAGQLALTPGQLQTIQTELDQPGYYLLLQFSTQIEPGQHCQINLSQLRVNPP